MGLSDYANHRRGERGGYPRVGGEGRKASGDRALKTVLLCGILASVIACAPLEPRVERTALTAYLFSAHDIAEHCVEEASLADERGSESVNSRYWAALCGIEAHSELYGLYDEARRAVRYERGTTMYLRLHRERWTALMKRMEWHGSQPSDAQQSQLRKDLLSLEDVARKLQF